MTPEYKAALAGLDAARGKVKGAEQEFQYRFGDSPAVKSAKAEVDAAGAEIERLKKAVDPDSPALVQAGQRRLAAQEKLQRLTSRAMASDPGVLAAKRDLAAAESRLRRAYEQAIQPRTTPNR